MAAIIDSPRLIYRPMAEVGEDVERIFGISK
jgi:hypothetical protein